MERKSADLWVLFLLVTARVRIDTLAQLVLPTRHEDTRRLLGGLIPARGLDLLADWMTDPATLLLISLSFGLLAVYAAVWLYEKDGRLYRVRLALACAIIGLLVFGQTALMVGLRHVTGPAAYTHDGGVIQTEVTIEYFTTGKNPYVEDYLDTPMAEWGIEYRTALYHYPYLPWTFVFSTPFYLLCRAVMGWFDQRFVYLLLFALTLWLAAKLPRDREDGLLLVMLLGLNPILGSDVIFGQNDSFVFAWVAAGVWFLRRWEESGRDRDAQLASLFYGLACASKPTAWFLGPFWLLYLLRGAEPGALKTLLRRAWPLAAAVLLVVGPWFAWDAGAMMDDVWRWSSGTSETAYQIRGWGLSNFVLAFGFVEDRLAYWPFWIPEILVAAPILALGLWRQYRRNKISTMLYAHTALLLGFLYASRFLNENYLGYIFGFAALAYFIDPIDPGDSRDSDKRGPL